MRKRGTDYYCAARYWRVSTTVLSSGSREEIVIRSPWERLDQRLMVLVGSTDVPCTSTEYGVRGTSNTSSYE